MLSDIAREFIIRATDRQLKFASTILDGLLDAPMVDNCLKNGFSLRESLRFMINQLEVRDDKDPLEMVFRRFINEMLEQTAKEFE